MTWDSRINHCHRPLRSVKPRDLHQALYRPRRLSVALGCRLPSLVSQNCHVSEPLSVHTLSPQLAMHCLSCPIEPLFLLPVVCPLTSSMSLRLLSIMCIQLVTLYLSSLRCPQAARLSRPFTLSHMVYILLRVHLLHLT